MIHKKSKLLNELGISLNNGSNDEIENDKDDSNILSNISKFYFYQYLFILNFVILLLFLFIFELDTIKLFK